MRPLWQRSTSSVLVSLLVIVLSSFAGVSVAYSPTPIAPLAAGAAVVLSMSAFIWPKLCGYILIGASMVNFYTVSTSFGNIRIDQALVVAFTAGILLRCLVDNSLKSSRNSFGFYVISLLFIYIVMNALSSWLVAPEPSGSLRIVAWLVLSFATLIYFFLLIGTFMSATEVLNAMLIAGVTSAAIGIALYVSHLFTGSKFGVQVAVINTDLLYQAAKGTFLEANIFGSFQAFTVVALIASAGQPGISQRRRHLLIVGLMISMSALLISFTRGAWLGLCISVIILLMISSWTSSIRLPLKQLGVIGVCLLPFLALLGAFEIFTNRAASTLQDASGTYAFRSGIIGNALQEWLDSPLWGYGTNSYAQYHPAQRFEIENHLSSLVVATLFDSGLLGLIPLMAALTLLLVKLWRLTLRGTDHEASASAGAVLAGIICLLIAYQATNAFWFSYNWIVVAIGIGLTQRQVKV